MSTLSRWVTTPCASFWRRTSRTPPGMSRAAASVRGSPMTRKRYGEVSRVPSTTTPAWSASAGSRSPGSTNDVLATTRTAGPSMVSSRPGPVAGSVPARTPSTRARSCASCSAAREPPLPAVTRALVSSRSRASVRSLSARSLTSSRIRTRSVCRSPSSPVSWVARTCTTTAKPSTAHRTAGSRWPRLTRGRNADASRVHAFRCAETSSKTGSSGAGRSWWPWGSDIVVPSGLEQLAPDGGGVGEDADTEHDHDAGRQLGADAELVAQVDDEGSDGDVGDERHHEDLVVEDAVEQRPHAAEDGVERGDHRDGE